MRLRLDTQIVLWQLQGSSSVGRQTCEAIERASELTFSVVSFAEIGIKAAIGKLAVPDDLHEHIFALGVRILGLAPDHGLGSPASHAPSRSLRPTPHLTGPL